MIYNGIDYQPYNSVYNLPGPSDLFFYYTLGESSTRIWDVASYSGNVIGISIDSIAGTWYAFVHASYPENDSYQDSADIRRTNISPSILNHFEWTTLVGSSTYSGPIWKDYNYVVPIDAPRVEYLLRYNGYDIYKGYSYTIDEVNNICVNDIARDYLYTNFPEALNTWYQDYNSKKTFQLYIGLTENSEPTTKAADLTFLYDWSYSDYLDSQYDSWLAMEPIQNYYDSRQYHIFSVNTLATLTNRDDITYINLNDSRSHIKTQLPVGSYRLYNYDAPGLFRYDFTVRDNCGVRYCLYYVNSRGGWDSVLVEGTYLQSDRYERETYTRNYLTPSIQRGTIEYRNNIHETWTLYLRGLSDNQNKLYHNLYESTNVYLHDLEEGRIIPVIITSSEMQYKTRKNQGKKRYSYEIQVESSQNKLRM